VGSGGGVSPNYTIPLWQQGINMAAVGGSTAQRNFPDVGMNANNVYVYFNNGSTTVQAGTSCAAPLWAGFTALVNQQAANYGLNAVGFLNPAIYRIGQGPLYNSCFNDITNGNNIWPGSPTQFNSAPGYDLCTGWGTPKGRGLIDALMAYAGTVWVDFNYTNSTEDGSYNYPFTTLAQGTNAVAPGGNIWIRSSGSSSETMTISKPMTIRAIGGPGTIGQ
jgi:subtilase family serine protease